MALLTEGDLTCFNPKCHVFFNFVFEVYYLFEMFTVDIQLAYMNAANSHRHRVRGPLRMCFDCKTVVNCILTGFVQELFGGVNMLNENKKHSKYLCCTVCL